MAPPAKALYRMSHEELKKLKVQLGELLAKGNIKPNKSPYGACEVVSVFNSYIRVI
jgi:hypothetical protein